MLQPSSKVPQVITRFYWSLDTQPKHFYSVVIMLLSYSLLYGPWVTPYALCSHEKWKPIIIISDIVIAILLQFSLHNGYFFYLNVCVLALVPYLQKVSNNDKVSNNKFQWTCCLHEEGLQSFWFLRKGLIKFEGKLVVSNWGDSSGDVFAKNETQRSL